MCCEAPRLYATVIVRSIAPERRERRREWQLLAVEARIEARTHYCSLQRNSEETTMWNRSSQRLEREYRNVKTKMETYASGRGRARAWY